jgi:hypothetical protein
LSIQTVRNTHNWWELEMIANENETIRKTERPQARR